MLNGKKLKLSRTNRHPMVPYDVWIEQKRLGTDSRWCAKVTASCLKLTMQVVCYRWPNPSTTTVGFCGPAPDVTTHENERSWTTEAYGCRRWYTYSPWVVPFTDQTMQNPGCKIYLTN